jgi:hypothetical protein
MNEVPENVNKAIRCYTFIYDTSQNHLSWLIASCESRIKKINWRKSPCFVWLTTNIYIYIYISQNLWVIS